MHLGISLRAMAAFCALLVSLSGCGGGGGGGGGGAGFAATSATGPAPAGPAASEPALSMMVTSKKTGSAYPIQIYLPASYKTGSAAYPVIYATDADDRFSIPGSTRFDRFKFILEHRRTEAILVGIGNTANRQTDYNFPGATAYRDFITLELIPLIEAQYRADATKRMLSGLSTGGSFVLTTFLAEAPDKLTFSYYLSSEAAIWQQAATVAAMETQLFDRAADKEIPATLILAHCTQGGNSTDVVAMYNKIASRNYRGLKLSNTSFPYSHAEMDVPAFDDAIQKLFPPAP